MTMKMTISRIVLAAALALGVGGAAAWADEDGGEFVIIKSDQLEWREVAIYPGLEFALLEGNPNQPGLYILRAKFPPGVMTKPHYHSRDRFVTVISGIWHAGVGEDFDPENTTPLRAGDFMKHSAGAIHFDGARDEEAIVEIRGLGPVETTSVWPGGGKVSE